MVIGQALHDLETIVGQAPFDVLRAAEVRLDPPPEPHEPHGLRIRQRRLLLPLRADRHFPSTAARQGVNGTRFGGDRPGDDFTVPHREDVRIHQAGDEGFAEAEAGCPRWRPSGCP